MLPCNFSITVNIAGINRVLFVDAGGNVSNIPVDLTEAQVEVVMNCIQAGYWCDVAEGLVVSWDRRNGSDVVHRVIEINPTQDGPLEFEQIRMQDADCAFIIGSNHKTGVPFYVSDYMNANPFVDTFKDSKLIWVDELVGIDKIIQRGYISDTLNRFHGMFHDGVERDMHIVWAKVKG